MRVPRALEESTLHIELSGAKPRVGLRAFPLAQRRVESVLLNGEPLTPADWVVHNDGTLLAQLAQTRL